MLQITTSFVCFTFLATGKSFCCPAPHSQMGKTIVSEIIKDICKAIWAVLRYEYLCVPMIEMCKYMQTSGISWIVLGSYLANTLQLNIQPEVVRIFIIINIFFYLTAGCCWQQLQVDCGQCWQCGPSKWCQKFQNLFSLQIIGEKRTEWSTRCTAAWYSFKSAICIARRQGISTTAIFYEAILSNKLGRQEVSL